MSSLFFPVLLILVTLHWLGLHPSAIINQTLLVFQSEADLQHTNTYGTPSWNTNKLQVLGKEKSWNSSSDRLILSSRTGKTSQGSGWKYRWSSIFFKPAIIKQIYFWLHRELECWLMERQEHRQGEDGSNNYYHSKSLEANHNINSAEPEEQVEERLQRTAKETDR